MLIFLPILTFMMLFLTLLGVQSRRQESLVGVRTVFLETASFLGGYMLVFSEVLSLFKLLKMPWVALCWAGALVGVGWFGWRSGLISGGFRHLRSKWQRPDWFDILAGIASALVLALLLITALLAPPNNNDSLLYHMSRVSHWAQNGSLAHYATGFIPQLMQPIGAEITILNARLLWGNDRLANLVQWFSMVGVLMAVTSVANLLGAKKQGQWLGVAFIISLPIGLLEATSTQNDYVTAFWLVSLMFFVLLASRRRLNNYETVCTGLILGLGMLTKATFYFYALLPLGYYGFIRLYKARQTKLLTKSFMNIFLIGVIAIVINLGFWCRNLATFGSIFGQKDFVSRHIMPSYTAGRIAGSVLRGVLQNFPTPSDDLNTRIVAWVKNVFTPLDPSMQDFVIEWAWNYEDLAGNPMHVVLSLLTVAFLIANRKRKFETVLWHYLIILVGSYVILLSAIGYDLYGVRYQLPFFVAWAPLFGIALESLGRKWLSSAVIAFLLIAALPWVLFNRTRPLIAMRDSSDPFTIPCLAGCTMGSILNEPPSSIIFGTLSSQLRGPYTQAAEALKASGCKTIGLRLDSSSPEYLFWWLLDAPQSGIRLEMIHTYPELERYLDHEFKPCAIVCTICKQGDYLMPHLNGLDLASDYSGVVQLYLGDHYDPDSGE